MQHFQIKPQWKLPKHQIIFNMSQNLSKLKLFFFGDFTPESLPCLFLSILCNR
jgi:hypothetical protein